MFSDTRRAAVAAVTALVRSTPSTSLLHSLPQVLLDQEFDGASNVKAINIKGQIDGNDVFAAEGDVLISGRTSHAVAIVTYKDTRKRLYTFLVVNYFKSALPSEIHAGLAAIFGAKLD